MVASPGVGSALAVCGKTANRIAGSGMSHLVKLRPTLVLLRSKNSRLQVLVLVVASRGCRLVSMMGMVAVQPQTGLLVAVSAT